MSQKSLREIKEGPCHAFLPYKGELCDRSIEARWGRVGVSLHVIKNRSCHGFRRHLDE